MKRRVLPLGFQKRGKMPDTELEAKQPTGGP